MNVQALIIKLLLTTEDRQEALERFNELKREYFSESLAPLLGCVAKFYEQYERIPNVEELKLEYSRNNSILQSLASLEIIDTTFCNDFTLAHDVLLSEYTQDAYLNLLDKHLDKLNQLSSGEIVEAASTIALRMEEITKNENYVHSAKTTRLFKSKEDREADVMNTGISKLFDNEYGAIRRGELFLLGGKRGAGKSIICSNICNNAYNDGFIAPYISIEMRSEEVLARNLAISSKVPAIKIRNAEFNPTELFKLAEAKADMFVNGTEILNSLTILTVEDYVLFEDQLEAIGELRTDRQIVIIDDPELKLSSLDNYLAKLKKQHGERLGPVVVDYVNQIVVDGHESDMYDWKVQIYIAKALKNIARKHKVAIFSPYQIDDSGQARMSKGILDSADFAFIVEAHKGEHGQGYLTWTGTKARGLPVIDFNVAIDWNTLSIDPAELTSQDMLQLTGICAEESSGGDYEL